jgi:hypothetical protein
MPERPISRAIRAAVVARAYGCCEYCLSQSRFATQSFSVEHIVPRSKGGTSDLQNLALSCQGCNNYKYDKITARDPVTGASAPLYHPRQHSWTEHFTWNDDFTLVLGTTANGRATVEALRLNRPSLVNLRRALFAVGEHPPPRS